MKVWILVSRALPALLLASLSMGNHAWAQALEVFQAFPQRAPEPSAGRAEERPSPAGTAFALALERRGEAINLGPVTGQQLAKADATALTRCQCKGPLPPRTGLVRALPPMLTSADGKVVTPFQQDPDTGLWVLALRSPGALAVRVHFTAFWIREGSAIVWSRVKDSLVAHGPYLNKGPGGRGEFWTPTVPGEVIFIEVSSVNAPQLEVGEIVHIDRDPSQGGQGKDVALAQASWCHLDAMCYSPAQVDPTVRDAVVQLNFVSGGVSYSCSGTILNDTDDETVVPYLLTAYHCLHKQAEVNTLEAVFFWQHDSCGGTLPNYATLPRTLQGTLLETNPTDGGNDMTFIRLNGSVPAGGGLAGWTTDYINSSYGIHHPGRDWKRVTFFHDDASPFSGCFFFDFTDYHFVWADDGFIEDGSSGSPLLNWAGQVMGQLYGICCNLGDGLECQGINCSSDPDDWRAVYGEFETTYPIIKRWLDLGGTIHVDWKNVEPPWLGTRDDPCLLVNQATGLAWDGCRIMIQAGAYREAVTFSKRMTVLASGGPVTIGQ